MPIYDVGEMWDSRSGSRGGGGDELVVIDVYGIPDGDGDPTVGGARTLALAEAPTIPGLFIQKIGHKVRGGSTGLRPFRRGLASDAYKPGSWP